MPKRRDETVNDALKENARMSGLIARVCVVLGLNVAPPKGVEKTKTELEHEALAAWCKREGGK